MFINKVISYKGAWERVINEHSDELDEIVLGIPEMLLAYEQRKRDNVNFISSRELWERIMDEKGWTSRNPNRRLNIRPLGPVKNKLSVAMPLSIGVDFLTRWLFNLSTVAIRNQIIELPILVTGIAEFQKRQNDRAFVRDYFEIYLNQLITLSPIHHSFPFLIIGFSDQYVNLADIQVSNLESDTVENDNKIVDKSIEFTSEYHVAGLNILNYFGTYLRKKYPNEDAKVKIEQDGLIVRLIVESKDGKLEVIEKALHEYQLIVTGQQSPEEIVQDKDLVLELKSELRLAVARIEMQKDMLQMKNDTINQFNRLLEIGLTSKSPVIIDFKPTISNSSIITINPDINKVIKDLGQLKSLINPQDPLYLSLEEIEEPLVNIQNEQNPEVVKHSSAMVKLKEFVEKVSKGNAEIDKTLKVAKKGWDTFKEIAGTYNSIAQWCGLPQVPTIFTK
jgi:hypothetical protein